MADNTDDKSFDVFLSHNSKDKPAVIELAESLKANGVTVWLDIWELAPGSTWQKELENIIATAQTAAVFFGSSGLGPWEDPEMRACLSEFVDRKMTVIPVLLPGAPEEPDLPLFLRNFTWLDLRTGIDTDGLEKLIWGITGKKPGEMVAPGSPDPGAKPDPERVSNASVRDWFSPQWPVTDPALFGREGELQLLNDAWNENHLNVVTLVAAGGVGKTALVNRWLYYHMQPDNWRGAARVFAWSFYSQGAAEGRQSSADPFIDKALRWFGDTETADTPMAAHDKGQRLAELVREERTLLLLDGVEPLQEAPGVAAQHPGRLKDPGLQGLLRGLALNNPGLCVLSTRIHLADLDPFAAEGGTVLEKDLDDLTPETGAAYLTSMGVTGTNEELKAASKEHGNHALALTLLGRFLHRYHKGDVRKRDEIGDLFKEKVAGHHAMRVMAWYAKEFEEQPEGELLHVLGLFDRPVDMDVINAVRDGEPIRRLTEKLSQLESNEWTDVLENLRDLRLLAKEEQEGDQSLDCHPLVREYLGDQLKTDHPDAWKAAHNRLYEYYCALPDKDLPDTAEEMAPLYQAVIHGCHAGHHQETMDEVYRRRIHRGNEAYGIKKLGACGADLSALAGFFDSPWRTPVGELEESSQAYVLNEAAFVLRALGRLAEAVAPLETGLAMRIEQKNWKSAAIQAGNLSELLLTLGRMEEAPGYAERSAGYADDGGDAFFNICQRTSLANAQHEAGRLEEATEVFRQAEAKLIELQFGFSLLFALSGYQYCVLLLAQGDAEEAQRRANQTLVEWAKTRQGSILDIALDHLTLGLAELALAVTNQGADLGHAAKHLDAAVSSLRTAGQQQFLPSGLLARAGYYRAVGDVGRGRQDLEETWAIATRGGMRLHECDVHLECARLLTAMAATDEPIDATILAPDSPFALFLAKDDDRDWKDRALNAARSHIDAAAQLIEDTGYHRRDPEIPLETARVEALAGNKDVAREQLAEAKRLIDEMGCHCWDHDANQIEKTLSSP
jgi:tetratricopeptide (TPR) repeat protein